jgi:regulator of cell morphogenesis and NO signaling
MIHLTKKTFVKSEMKLTDLFFENPMLLLMMEHFDLNFVVHDKTVAQVCGESNISPEVFVSFANLYNGFHHQEGMQYSKQDILTMIAFLRNSHQYYKREKYPEIRWLIDQLYKHNETPEIKLVGKFFNDYFEEVTEHLDYEDQVAFPYFSNLIDSQPVFSMDHSFSADVYLDHHTDIESKLNELKNLLLRHIAIKGDRSLRRQLIFSLFELEYDLTIHSTIEESILIPAVKKLENQQANG